MSRFVVSLVGDMMLMRPIAASMIDAGSAAVSLLRDAGAAIGNCEFSACALAIDGPVPQVESGGLWLNAGAEATRKEVRRVLRCECLDFTRARLQFVVHSYAAVTVTEKAKLWAARNAHAILLQDFSLDACTS